MSKRFAVIGAGTQGVAASFDLASFADADCITLADSDARRAEEASQKVNRLVGREAVTPAVVDASDQTALEGLLREHDVAACCLPYWLQPVALQAALTAGVHFCDLDGEETTPEQLAAINNQALAAGVTVVSDTGLAPGLVNSIGAYLIEELDEVESIKLYCGVLPRRPQPPLFYSLKFNVDGLIAEYEEPSLVLRKGQIVSVPALTEIEPVQFEEAALEAFVTGGATLSAPYLYQGRVQNYEYKTLRYPGHAAKMAAYRDFGLWSEEPVIVDGATVNPRDLFRSQMARLCPSEGEDECFVRGVGIGKRDGEQCTLRVDIRDLQDPVTGFTSMQRLTGFSISIHAIELSLGSLRAGRIPYEHAMDAAKFLSQIERRGVAIRIIR